MIGRILAAVVVSALIAGASLSAHHSLAGVYSLGKEAKVTGAFKAFRLVNPHSSLKLDVKNDDGTTTEWSIVGGSVQALARLGIGKEGTNALKGGDEINVTMMPAADGKSIHLWAKDHEGCLTMDATAVVE